VVFPDKIFIFDKDDSTIRDEAVNYGLSIDISLEQLTFDID
jgi:hypothetical protein